MNSRVLLVHLLFNLGLLINFSTSSMAEQKGDGISIGTAKAFHHPKSNYTLIYTLKKATKGGEYGWEVTAKSPDGKKYKVAEGSLFVFEDRPNWSPDGLFLSGYIWAGSRQSCVFVSLRTGEVVEFKTSKGKSATCDNSGGEWKDGADHSLKVSIGRKKFDYAEPVIESE